MTDTKKESLSAFIDGEANEVEVHRLLRELGDDDSLKASWASFTQLGDLAREGAPDRVRSPGWHLALHGSIHAALAKEPAHGKAAGAVAPRPVRRHYYYGGGLAAAACLLAVALGLVFLGPDAGQEGPPLAAADAADAGAGEALELTALDEDKQRRLRNYLNQHSRLAQLNGRRPLAYAQGRQQLARAREGLAPQPSLVTPAAAPRTESAAQTPQTSAAIWRLAWLPEGFRPVGTPGNRLHFSDGRATLSVFVEPSGQGARGLPEAAFSGGTVVVTRQSQGGPRITVVGDVPVRLARRVAKSVEQLPQ